jgi:hypothetical protein
MLILSGAYGRDYTSKAAILRDLEAGLDFAVRTMGARPYANAADLQGQKVQVRYAKDRKVTILTVPAIIGKAGGDEDLDFEPIICDACDADGDREDFIKVEGLDICPKCAEGL